MRYFHSEMWSGNKPKAWVETALEDERKIIEHFYNSECYVHDADVCGDEVVYFAFSSGKFFKLSYRWYMDYDPEWQIYNDFEIEEVSKSETKNLAADRDWLVI